MQIFVINLKHRKLMSGSIHPSGIMGGLEERVGSLVESGRDDLAAELLRASFHSRGIDEVEFVSSDSVRVVSGPFSGIHDIEIDSVGDVSIDPESRYQYSGAEIKTEFTVRSLTDSEYEAIRDAVQPECDTETAEASASPDGKPPSPPVLPDGGNSEFSSPGLRARLLNVFSNDK